ncbi:DsbE family thiol:disulfide interchange protein [Methylococcus capsulatus]|uniref:DsbE family thiol:disulfide interchange protein n=1 Tax=Methylococcus capsulatus TaxID=414 RepID=UPI001C531045|nr:DsbE family thiol:disulfide interchange protein [Methylococcus capsulatus]QXP89874.1 DsbE family thiol:disulfide interchange protein [Methylococcus capsulatus]
MPRLFLLLPLLIFSILGFLFFQGMNLDPNTLPSPLLGKRLPAFELPALRDLSRTIRDGDIEGPALVNFWASWCAACRDEHALLVDLARNAGVKIYGIDYVDQRDAALGWLDRLGDPYVEVLFDERGTLGAAFQVMGAPETYAVDGDNIVRYRHVGRLTWEVWTAMQAALAGPALRPGSPEE